MKKKNLAVFQTGDPSIKQVAAMYMRILGSCLFALGLCMASYQTSAAEDVEVLLARADEVRSSAPGEFRNLLKELNARKGEATAGQLERLHYLHAYSLGITGNYGEAIRSARSLLETSKDVDMQTRTGALLVNLHAVTREFAEGLRQLDRTLSMLDRVKNPDYREQAFGVAAVAYNQAGQYQLGQEYAEKVLKMTTSTRAQCYAGQTRLEALQNLGDASVEEKDFSDLIALCAGQGEAVVANLSRAMLARKWAATGQYEKAIELLQAHLAEVKATGYPRLVSEFESLLGQYELATGNVAAAAKHANATISQSAVLASSPAIVEAYKTLYEIAGMQNDAKTALAFYRQYTDAEKAYLGDVKAREMAYHIVKNQSMQQAQQIELLNKQNEVLQLQQRVSDQKAQSSSLLILLLFVLTGSIGYWAFKTKRMQMSLRRMAETDALTGIFNRHYFTQQSDKTLVQSARAGEDVALIMFDLDHFKSINDRFGHDTGDWVLTRIAESCKTFCRRIDHLGRIGGEEFAILLSGCDLRGATRVAEDCRVRMASIDTQPSGHKFLVTASFGVTASSLSGYDLAKLLSHADKMLYRAKREGRNRVCTFDGETQQWTQLQPVAVADPALQQVLETVSREPFRQLTP